MRDRIREWRPVDATDADGTLHRFTATQTQLLGDIGARGHVSMLEQLHRSAIAHLAIVLDHALDTCQQSGSWLVGRDLRAAPLTPEDQAARREFIKRPPCGDPGDRKGTFELAFAGKVDAGRKSAI
jgi:hypothetical protein